MRTTQDDTRENMQIKLFNLDALSGRSNKYIPDATLEVKNKIHKIELKTCDVNRKQVSTARNVTLNKIEEWKKVLWIFSSYKKNEAGPILVEHYLGNSKMLNEWFEKQAEKIKNGTKTYAGLDLWTKASSILEEHFDNSELEKLNNSYYRKGSGLNDPKISWSYIENNCIKLNLDDLENDLRKQISLLSD